MESNPQWEIFCDDGYYHMWCVRNIGDRSFNSPMSFHFIDKEDAEKFLELASIAK